jgi:hypothetical protein
LRQQLGRHPVAVVQNTFINKEYIKQHNRQRQCIEQLNSLIRRTGPVFARYILAFALQLRKKHGKTSIRVVEECQLAR